MFTKIFQPLRMLYPFIKSFVNPFVNISLTFLDRSSSFFLTSTCPVLFKVTFLLTFIGFSSRYVFFTKSAIWLGIYHV